MRFIAFAAVYCLVLTLSTEAETKTVLLGSDHGGEEELVIDVEAGQVLEILGYDDNICVTWEIDFGEGVVFSTLDDIKVRVLAGPLKLKVIRDCSPMLLTYRLSHNTPFPAKVSPVLTKLSLEGPKLTSEYAVSPGFIYSLSSSSDLVVWEKLSDHSSEDGKVTISQPTSDKPDTGEFFKLE